MRATGHSMGEENSPVSLSDNHIAVSVTIAIPVYNGENFIAEAIESILGQSYDDLELIICDNASTDSTEAICREYARQDPRVRYFRNSRNLGAAANYNRGLELARGKYFKWNAHDDWLSSNYVEACVRILDTQPEVVVAYGEPREMLDRHTPYADSRFKVEPWGDAGPVERFGKAVRMPRTCHAIFGLIRRADLMRTTLHRPYYTSDRILVAELALLGRFACAPEATFYNRKHLHQSMAQAANRLALSTWQDTSKTRTYCTMNLDRLHHLFEVVGRHKGIASRAALLRVSFTHVFSASAVLLLLDEVLWMRSPRIYGALRRHARQLFRKIKPPRRYITGTQTSSAIAGSGPASPAERHAEAPPRLLVEEPRELALATKDSA